MAEDEDIKELKKELSKLRPKDRIKKLKALEEKRKQEVVEIEDLIKDSENELKTDSIAEEITPEQFKVDIGRLFEEEVEHLERTVKEESIEIEKEERGYISFGQAYGDYSKLKDIAYASMMGPLSTAQMDSVDRIGERLDMSRYQSASKEIANILVASRATLYKIRKYAGLE